MLSKLALTATLLTTTLAAASPQKIHNLYNSLQTDSVSQHLAFYHLYPDTPDGHFALRHALLLMGGAGIESMQNVPLTPKAVDAIVALVNKQPEEIGAILDDRELNLIDRLGEKLHNRSLKGKTAATEQEVMLLPPEEIDIARGLFLSQFGDDVDALRKIRTYEAVLDLMALQIMAKLPKNATPEIVVETMNQFIFHELGFRFPPHSLYAKDIDLYSFLPSVLDSRRGVCLGVSILYLCLAQRLNLPLEIITPPGHIFVRYEDDSKAINIETTARGIDLEDEIYLGVEVKALERRNSKEVIGMAHFNAASVFWQQSNYPAALASYEKAEPYMKDDLLLKELMGYMCLLSGKTEKGEALLKEVQGKIPPCLICKETIADDYFNGDVNVDGIEAVFLPVDETRESILKKKNQLEATVNKYPKFRAGVFSLAVAWLQLHRMGEALEVLRRYHELDSNDPTGQYYLSVLHAERMDYNQAWKHLRKAEEIVKKAEHDPKALKILRKELSMCCPP